MRGFGEVSACSTARATSSAGTPFADRAASPYGYYVIVDAAARTRPAVRALERWLLDEAHATGG